MDNTEFVFTAEQYLKRQSGRVLPNGFTSWHETHAEICFAIGVTLTLDDEKDSNQRVNRVYESQGRGGIYELAEELTDKFELLNKGREWDGEFFEAIDIFILNELA